MIWVWHSTQHSEGCANQQEICTTGAECPTPHKPRRGSLGPALAQPHTGAFTLGVQLRDTRAEQPPLRCCPTAPRAALPTPDTIPAIPCPLLQAFLSPCSLHNTLPGLSYIPHPLITPASFHPVPEHPRTSQLCPHLGTPHPPPTPAASHPLCFTPSTASGYSLGWVPGDTQGSRGHTGTTGTQRDHGDTQGPRGHPLSQPRVLPRDLGVW